MSEQSIRSVCSKQVCGPAVEPGRAGRLCELEAATRSRWMWEMDGNGRGEVISHLQALCHSRYEQIPHKISDLEQRDRLIMFSVTVINLICSSAANIYHESKSS